VRCVVFERQIAKEDLFDAVLGEDFESWSCSSCSSTTEDTLETAYNEEFLDEETDIRKLSLGFDNNELSDILAAAAAPPRPRRISGRGTAIVSNTCSWPSERTTEGPPDAHLAWGSLAQRCKLAQPAPPAPNSDNEKPANRSPSASFVHDASSFSTNARASDTFHQRQSMPVKEQRASADVSLPAGEDDSKRMCKATGAETFLSGQGFLSGWNSTGQTQDSTASGEKRRRIRTRDLLRMRPGTWSYDRCTS